MVIGGESGHVPTGVTLDNWQSAAHLHWTFQHIAEFLPTAVIARGFGPRSELPERESIGLTDIALTSPVDHSTYTVGSVIAATATDGWIVTQHGTILEEHYYGGMTPDTAHLLMSVSKSLIGMVAGVLVDSGTLNPAALLTDYVPALSNSGYVGASVRDVLDMRSGIKFSEDYLDPMAEVRLIEQAIGWAPQTVPDLPTTVYGFLASLQQSSPHGGPFHYRSCETDILGWACEAAAGVPMPELMSTVLWSPIGAQRDAIIGVDQIGTGLYDGGINACLRDLIRFGILFNTGGVTLTGTQLVSPAWIADTFTGGPDSRAAFANSPGDNRMPGGMYRNQCWLPYPGDNVLLCLGIHGQMIYVNRSAGVVAAKLSSWPQPQDPWKLLTTIAAFDAISAQLS